MPKTQQTMIGKLLNRSFDLVSYQSLSFEWVKNFLSIGDIDMKAGLLASVLSRTATKRNSPSNVYYQKWIESFDDNAFIFLTTMAKQSQEDPIVKDCCRKIVHQVMIQTKVQ
jgi:hypothetical protein